MLFVTLGNSSHPLPIGGEIEDWKLLTIVGMNGSPTAIFEKRVTHQGALLGGYLPAAHTGSGVICRDGGYMDYRIEWDFPGVIYDRAMVGSQFFDDDFKAAVQVAGAQARIETLQAGVPVFYRDRVRKLNIIEYPNGKKFEIRFLDGAPGDQNYEVIRELDETAA